MKNDTGDYCELRNAGTDSRVYAQLHNPADNCSSRTHNLYDYEDAQWRSVRNRIKRFA